MFDTNKIKECMKLARETVQDEDEPFKTESYKILFSKFLDSQQFHQINLNPEPDPAPDYSLDQKMFNFAKNCNLTVKELRDVYYVKDDMVYLIASIEGNEAEKQSIATQCILTATELLFDIEWLDSSKLMKCVELSGIEGLYHLARNLRTRNIFRIRGKGKGKILEYKISNIGKLQSFEIIHDLAKGESA